MANNRKIFLKDKCLLCGEKLLENSVIEFNNMPASAQNIPMLEQLNFESGLDLKLYQCPFCGLIQFNCEPVNYYKNVIRAGGYSTTMKELRFRQYEHLINTYGLQGKKFLEIGCGQGEFLSILKNFPVEPYGIENSQKLVSIAKNKSLNVIRCFLDNEKKLIKNGPFDVFLSFNFLEHQPNPNKMLKAIYNNLTDDGIGLITVPSFEYILDKMCYYEFIRDHLAYYTFETLCFALNKNGFEVLEKELINRDTLSVIVRKRKKQDFSMLIEKQKSLYEEINKYVDGKLLENKKVAVWGAGHQGFTVISTTNLHDKINCIIDSAPFKQGLYSPASHVPIISPEKALSRGLNSIIIIAPGYTDEIAKNIKEKFSSDIEIVALRTEKLEVLRNFEE